MFFDSLLNIFAIGLMFLLKQLIFFCFFSKIDSYFFNQRMFFSFFIYGQFFKRQFFI